MPENHDLPLYKVRCCYCAHWHPVHKRESAEWGYCERWEVAGPIHSHHLPGLTLFESESLHFDQKVVTHESFGCNRITRVHP